MATKPKSRCRTLWIATGALAATFLPAAPCRAFHMPGEHRSDAKRQVEVLEAEWRQAQLSGALDTLDRLLADDFVGISMSGQVNTKAQVLSRMRNHTLVVSRMDMAEQKVKVVGEIAIVTVRATVQGTNKGTPVNGEFRYTRIYHRLPTGDWKITNFEATRVHSNHDVAQVAMSGKPS